MLCFHQDLRKAAEEEKERAATRAREKEEAARKKAAEANTEKWDRSRRNLEEKIKAKGSPDIKKNGKKR